MALTVGVIFQATVGVGASTGRALSSHRGVAASPRTLVGGRASVNGAVRELVRKAWSSRFPRNLALRRGRMGRGIMTVGAHLREGRVLRSGYLIATHCVTGAHSGRAVCPFTAMSPNPAVNRTPAGVAAYGERFVGAGYLVRWASGVASSACNT